MRNRVIVGILVSAWCGVAAQAELVGHWRMGDDATFAGGAWTVPDQTADPADATSFNMVETNRVDGFPAVANPGNQALQFVAADGAYLNIGTPAKLDLTASVSVCGWFNWNGGGTQRFQPILGKGDNQYMLRFDSDRVQFAFFTNDADGWHQVDGTLPIVAEEWYFVTGICDGTNVTIYVNGVQGETAAGGITASADPVEIGRNSTNTDRVSDGTIDQVRVYNHALTEQEILDLYNERAVPASILSEPEIAPSQFVVEGTDVTITIEPDGTAPLSFAWFKDTVAVPGGTNSVLDLPGVVEADGGEYNVVVNNALGSATSTVATLNVGAAGQITIFEQPQPLTRVEGDEAIFSASVVGDPPLSFQWSLDGTPVPGATDATYTIPAVGPADVGDYTLEITNATTSAQTTGAALTTVPLGAPWEETIAALDPDHWWRFDEEFPELVAADSSGGEDLTHGTFVNSGISGATFSGLPLDNLAVGYGGIAGDGSEAQGPLLNGLSTFTISCLFSGMQIPPDSTSALLGQNDAVEMAFVGTTFSVSTSGGGEVSVDSAATFNPNQWYHVTAVGDGTDLRLYVNGVLVGTGGSPTADYGASDALFQVAMGVVDVGDNNFWGDVDEPMVFKRALNAEMVANLSDVIQGGTIPVTINSHPSDATLYAGAPAATFDVVPSGSSPLSYQWRKGGAPIVDGGTVSGANTGQLVISPVAAADAGSYDVVVSNLFSSATSDPATLTVIEPIADSYEEAALALDPNGYWRLNEPNGAGSAVEAWNGRDGTYNDEAIPGVPGPAGIGFEGGNTAVQIVADTAGSEVALPSLGFDTNTATISCWVYMDGDQGGFRAIVFQRSGGTISGLHVGDGNELRYTWNNADPTWSWDSGLVAPTNQWVFATLVVEPNQATMYLGAGGVLQSAVNTTDHANQNFNATPMYIGWDQNNNNRHFNGSIDEVVILGRALSLVEVQGLYYAAVGEPALLEAEYVPGGDLILTWPDGGTLESTTELLLGPWDPVPGATSPWTNTPSMQQEYWRSAE